ncbi:MAG: nucleotidyltransferase family protein [Actinomycetota bacterium]|nr:nucleotidyltransferase family protein [Actinomycetota bacterium]
MAPVPDDDRFEAIIATLKRSVAALRDAGVPFAVAGGLAYWARGGPMSHHDVDLVVAADDVKAATAALVDVGMEPEDPPEEWLTKVHDGDITVDLIFHPSGVEITPELLARADELHVQATTMPVLPLEDVLVTQLLSFDERYLDYEGLIEQTRAVREQVDWDAVRTRTKESPFARAFFTIVEGLGIVGG